MKIVGKEVLKWHGGRDVIYDYDSLYDHFDVILFLKNMLNNGYSIERIGITYLKDLRIPGKNFEEYEDFEKHIVKSGSDYLDEVWFCGKYYAKPYSGTIIPTKNGGCFVIGIPESEQIEDYPLVEDGPMV